MAHAICGIRTIPAGPLHLLSLPLPLSIVMPRTASLQLTRVRANRAAVLHRIMLATQSHSGHYHVIRLSFRWELFVFAVAVVLVVLVVPGLCGGVRCVCVCAQMNPAMQDLLGQFDMESPAMKQQLAQLGTSPDEVRDARVNLGPCLPIPSLMLQHSNPSGEHTTPAAG